MRNIYFYDTSIGRIGISEETGCIKEFFFEKDLPGGNPPAHGQYILLETPVLKEASIQLGEYLAGRRKTFELPLAPEGTPFMREVWQCLVRIPYGQTNSYGHIAAAAGKPKASRAVGMANNRNPIPVFIPCHRVIGSNGKLTGYRGGLDIKQKLLDIEKYHSDI